MKCIKCGMVSSGKYCPECGARLKSEHEANFQALQRWYRDFRKTNADTYPLWTVADGCFQAAKAMQNQDPRRLLSQTCTSRDVEEITENTAMLFAYMLAKKGGVQVES